MKHINRRNTQQGMTLIEIMIAMLIGAFLLGGMIQIFTSTNQTYRMQNNMSRLQENGRFAMDFITKDIRMADYWGCVKTGLSKVTNNIDSTGTGYDADIHGFGAGLNGANGTAAVSAALDAPDTITLRGLLGNGIEVGIPYMGTNAAALHISANNGLEQADVVVVSDCSQADIFQITNASPSTSGTAVHNAGNAVAPGNATHSLSKRYGKGASISKVATTIYSIQTGQSGRNGLFRSINGDNDELVEGVENLQIVYGVDANLDGTADYYVPAGASGLNTATLWGQVISVRVTLLFASLDDNLTSRAIDYAYNGATGTPTDRRLRRVFSSTITVRNRL